MSTGVMDPRCPTSVPDQAARSAETGFAQPLADVRPIYPPFAPSPPLFLTQPFPLSNVCTDVSDDLSGWSLPANPEPRRLR